MTTLRFKNVRTMVSGDYYQVSFDDDADIDEPYFLLQTQFEMPDGDECYIESHMRELRGPYRVRNAVLSDGMLRLEYGDAIHVEISFSASSKDMAALQSALCDMLPDLVIAPLVLLRHRWRKIADPASLLSSCTQMLRDRLIWSIGMSNSPTDESRKASTVSATPSRNIMESFDNW